jgi:hypothetical protein
MANDAFLDTYATSNPIHTTHNLVLRIAMATSHQPNTSETPASRFGQTFQSGCKVLEEDGKRANTILLMVARNEDLNGALQAVKFFEKHFNRWFKYPILFLNDKPWDQKEQVGLAVGVKD